MNWHRCDSCGCYLDPGEGHLCDECTNGLRERKKEKERINRLFSFEGEQAEMRLEEMV